MNPAESLYVRASPGESARPLSNSVAAPAKSAWPASALPITLCAAPSAGASCTALRASAIPTSVSRRTSVGAMAALKA